MLQERLAPLRQRLDRLKLGEEPRSGGVARLWLRLGRPAEEPSLEALEALDRELDQVGVHTSEDARLLRKVAGGRAGALAEGLEKRAVDATQQYEARLRWVEQGRALGETLGGASVALENAYPKLARALKVADLFATGTPPAQLEVFTTSRPASEARFETPQLAAAAFFAARARTNAVDLVQKRRDLERAHELLLRAGNGLEREPAHALRTEVAASREKVRSAGSTRTLLELTRDLRGKLAKHPREAYRELRELYARSVEAGDLSLAAVARDAIAPALPVDAEANTRIAQKRETDDALVELAFELTDRERKLFDLSAGCARFFDIEESLSEEIVAQGPIARPRPRRVPYPTQALTFDITGSLDELPNFVITDPRMLVYDLAAGRQAVRAYLSDEPPPEPKRLKKTSVRVYVCDASGSMQGARARMRDAIVLAELNNLRLKALRGEPFDPLYFSFFNDQPTDLERVDNAPEARRQIQKLFDYSPARGQTDITLALIAAFDAIHAARGKDPYLGRATVVLITDGEDRVDLEVIRNTRTLAGVSIALSFISLGDENPDLRTLVEEQRSKGERAFYHHLLDAEIASAPTDFDRGFRTLVPAEVELTPEIVEQLRARLDQLERLARGQNVVQLQPDGSFDALFPAKAPEAIAEASPDEVRRIGDVLGAVAEAASLTLFEDRAKESIVLLQHLLGLYGFTVPRYLSVLASADATLAAALERVRVTCRPYG
jgi:hypothetical protein